MTFQSLFSFYLNFHISTFTSGYCLYYSIMLALTFKLYSLMINYAVNGVLLHPPPANSGRRNSSSWIRSRGKQGEPCVAFTQSRSPPGLFNKLLGFSSTLNRGRHGSGKLHNFHEKVWRHGCEYYSWFSAKLKCGPILFYKAAIYLERRLTSTSIHSDAPINARFMPSIRDERGRVVKLKYDDVYIIMLMTTSLFGSGEFILWR